MTWLWVPIRNTFIQYLDKWDIGILVRSKTIQKLDFFLQSAYGSCIQSVSYNTGVNCDKWAYLLLSAQKFTFNRTSWQPVESLRVVLTDIDWWQCVGMSAFINSTAVVCKHVPASHEPRCEKGCGSLSAEVSAETIVRHAHRQLHLITVLTYSSNVKDIKDTHIIIERWGAVWD